MCAFTKPLQTVAGTTSMWLRFGRLEGFREPAGNKHT